MNQDETNKQQREWLDALDAVNAAPEHHRVLLENERVRVLDTLIKSGDSTPVHSHRWSSVLYIIGASDFVRFDANGNVVFDSRGTQTLPPAGTVFWSPPLPPHSVKNVGDAELRVISVEMKD